MRVKLVCWIVLLVVACVASADQEVSKESPEEIESDIKTTVDNVVFEPKCDCGSEATKCEFKEGEKVCTCKDGYIPAGPDGNCTQVCDATHPCENGGTCLQDVCSCLNGTSGHLCKTIDDCSSRCGRADCFYNVTARDVYCKCKDGYGFDDVKKVCRACDCGSYSRGCSYVNGQKKCNCYEVYADQLGTCTLCYCKGYSSMYGCHFDDEGYIKCRCLKGYAQLNDGCQKCDCGSHGECRLYGMFSKYCTCEKGYAEKSGICEVCDCGENGTCNFSNGKKVCYCDKGFQDSQGTCKECDCGNFSYCKFDSYGKKECTCYDAYALKSGVCTPCLCFPGQSCIFKRNIEKECICPRGYTNFIGTCMVCDCRKDGSNCTLDTGWKKCYCPKGFEQDTSISDPSCIDSNECLRPQDNDCPFSTDCINTWGGYECVCKEGFEPINKFGNKDIKRDGCKDIDECRQWSACYDLYARCVNTPGSYRCDCEAGYSVKRDSYREKDNICIEDARPWRTASIVVGCLFGFVILGLVIGICSKQFNS